MKKAIIIIISLMVICLTTLGIIGFFVERNEAKNKESIEQNLEDEKVPGIALDVNLLDINKIEGFTPAGQVSDEGEKEDLDSDNSTSEEELAENAEAEDNVQEDSESEIKVGGLTLPFTIPYREVDVLSIGSYSGKFIEDGSDKKVENLLAMVIKNTSEETIEYGKIIFKIPGQNAGVVFQFSNLKPGSSALVLESTGKINFNEDEKYIYLDSKIETTDEMSLMSQDIKVSAKEKEITVENLTENNLNTVYVYYKTVDKGGCYLGGITYRVKLEKVTAGKTVSDKTIHFSPKNSEIIMIESVKE